MEKQTALIVDASRTLGLGIASAYLDRGWNVIGTVRGDQPTALHDLAARANGALEIEVMDRTVPDQVQSVPDQVQSVRERLQDRSLDTVFVSTAIADEDLRSRARTAYRTRSRGTCGLAPPESPLPSIRTGESSGRACAHSETEDVRRRIIYRPAL